MKLRPFQHKVLENPHCSKTFSLTRVLPTWNTVAFAHELLLHPAGNEKHHVQLIYIIDSDLEPV